MASREIPRSDWDRYLETLSNRKLNHPVKVRVESEELGDQPLAECMPLVGISLQRKGSEAGAIALTLSFAGGEGNLTHEVACPERLLVQEDAAGEPRTLDIEDCARVKTLVMFDSWQELPAAATSD